MKKKYYVLTIFILIVILGCTILVWTHKKQNSPILVGDPVLFQEVTFEHMAGQYGTEFPTLEQKQSQYQIDHVAHQNKTITFDSLCNAFPFAIEVKVDDTVLFDNISEYARKIRIGIPTTKDVNIPSHTYTIVRFSTPGEYSIRCDAMKNVAVIGVRE